MGGRDVESDGWENKRLPAGGSIGKEILTSLLEALVTKVGRPTFYSYLGGLRPNGIKHINPLRSAGWLALSMIRAPRHVAYDVFQGHGWGDISHV
ncbi:MAG: hypothetical protein EA402_04350 [Planctomycetota bacterium]|nr:MAG: hypothetical protein EA402_04350 [Planctomycetota bacterium]